MSFSLHPPPPLPVHYFFRFVFFFDVFVAQVRLWTRDSTRAASESIQAAFTEAVEQAKAKKKGGPSAEEVAKMPLWERRLETPGKSEGAAKVDDGVKKKREGEGYPTLYFLNYVCGCGLRCFVNF